ncbi:MAG: tetratricopeptide repeat protein [Gammaproteobacteria bacterium]
MTEALAKRLQEGLDHHRAGRLKEADASYRSVLAEEPRHPDGLYLLGVLALQVGQPQVALRLFRDAAAVRPGDAEVHNMCGEASRSLGDHEAAIASYRRALEIDPGHAGACINLGNACRDAGRIDEAIENYRRALDIDADLPMAHNNLGVVLRNRGRVDEATGHFEKAIALAPEYAEACTNLGNALLEAGRAKEAVRLHERAVKLRPDYVAARCNLGNALRLSGRLDDAIRQYKQAIALDPRLALAHYNLGIALDEAGRPAEAAARYEKAIRLQPDYPEALNNLGNVCDQLGRHEDAVRHYRRAIELRPHYAEAHRNLSRIDPAQVDRKALERLLEEPELAADDAVHGHFALGNAFQAAGDHGRAFEHFRAGNRLRRERVDYDAEQAHRDVDRLQQVFDEAHFDRVRDAGSDSQRPVFVLGMPRSGTTLVEQILASHPDVHGAGELDTLRRLEGAIAASIGGGAVYPECMREVSTAVISDYADRYLAELDRHDATAPRVTDKTPSNFLRIGLIRTLLPAARIIHVRRDPRDTCVSNYLHYFATGNEFSFDLQELGRFYLEYERLMAHWESLFPDGMLTVQYEELLADQESVSRRMVDYLGLEWDDACLAFYRTDRPVHTFSSLQVRRPVYRSAVGRWELYREQLQPLLEVLDAGQSGAGD